MCGAASAKKYILFYSIPLGPTGPLGMTSSSSSSSHVKILKWDLDDPMMRMQWSLQVDSGLVSFPEDNLLRLVVNGPPAIADFVACGTNLVSVVCLSHARPSLGRRLWRLFALSRAWRRQRARIMRRRACTTQRSLLRPLTRRCHYVATALASCSAALAPL